MTFGNGILLGQGGLVVCNGKAAGVGHYHGDYTGTATCHPTEDLIAFDLDVRVPAGLPVAAGLKAGPAGSTLHLRAKGPIPAPEARYDIDLAGHRGEMVLRVFEHLRSPPATAGETTTPHPDAYPDGLYRLESAGIGYLTHTVVVMCAGQLTGIGEMGGQYRGTYVFDEERKLTKVTGEARLPPGVPLIVGGSVGGDWLTAPMTSEGKYQKGKSRFSFALAGRAIDAELSFLRPLPT